MSDKTLEFDFQTSREDKEKLNNHKGAVFWFCGLSGSGKSTIADIVNKKLFDQGKQVVLLDGDSLRNGLCSDLGFSQEDRSENLRRAAEVAKLMAQNGNIVLTCFITPLESQREKIKKILSEDFHLIFVNTTVEECEKRDPKGLYKKAKAGEIKEFTGISSPFEIPSSPELELNTTETTPEDCASQSLKYILKIIA